MHNTFISRVAVSSVFAFNGVLFGAWATRIPAVAQALGLNHAQLAFVLLMLAFGAVLSFPLAGRWADAYGPHLVSKVMVWLYPLVFIPLALAPSAVWLGLILFVFGAVHGSMDIAMNAWAGLVERARGRLTMSFFHAMYSLGAGFGAASGYVASSFALPVFWHFVIIALLSTPLALYACIRVPMQAPPPLSKPTVKKPFRLRNPLPKGALLGAAFLAFCAALGEGAMADWGAIFLVSALFATEAQAALGYAVFSASMVAIRLLGDQLSMRLGPVPTARMVGASALIGALILLTTSQLAWALLGFALLGIGYGIVVPLVFTRATNDPTVPPGRAIASISILGYGGFLIGPVAIGLLAEATSIRVAMMPLVVLALCIIALSRMLRQPTPTTSTTPTTPI